MKRISLIDYGAGNLHSLGKALSPLGTVVIDRDVGAALEADLVILPGVGAFGQAARELSPFREKLKSALGKGVPCIGVCLGMQLLFDNSEESAGDGIGLIPGRVRRIDARRLPQMGWNTVEWKRDGSLVAPSGDPRRLESAYFANAFVGEPDDQSCIAAWTTHESDRFPSAVRVRNTVGIQFHPEKSSRAGVAFLRAVAEEMMACR